MNFKHVIFVILVYALNSFAFANEMPPAPKGMVWYDSKNGVGIFLKPKKWFIKEESVDGTKALFISRENIGKPNAKFIAGFSLNKISSFKAEHNVEPSIYAKSFIGNIIKDHEVLLADVITGGENDMNIARIRGDNNGSSVIVHHIAIGMDEPDILYLISFEAPESEWESLYKYAGPMLNFLFLTN